jgi:LPS O-antigen subunit length determinant protein (WzzB/FepE family)
VLNGTEIPKLASRVADFLRTKGFDVVQTGNAQHSNFKTSIVQDRLGNIQNALQVAKELGISESSVIQQKNPQLFLEVTVIIGQDYKSLKFVTAGN